MTGDGSHTYYYNAEGRLIQVDGTLGTCSSATMCYVYDANGVRVRSTQSSGASEWMHDLEGNMIAQYTPGYGWGRGWVYMGTEFLAEYGDGTTYFAQRDHQGSTRLMTKPDQSIADSLDYVPFGEGLSGGAITIKRYTGDERDLETGFDYMKARYYNSRMGSFLTPDPLDILAADLSDPQTLNRYAYTRNNPINLIDPLGLSSASENNDNPSYCDSVSLIWDYGIDPVCWGGDGGCEEGPCPNAFTNGYWAAYYASLIPPKPAAPKQLPKTANNGCLAQAAGNFALHGGTDALGFIPGVGGAAVATFSGYAVALIDTSTPEGINATSVGLNALGTGFLVVTANEASIAKFSSRLAEGIPGIGTAITIGSIALDGYLWARSVHRRAA